MRRPLVTTPPKGPQGSLGGVVFAATGRRVPISRTTPTAASNLSTPEGVVLWSGSAILTYADGARGGRIHHHPPHFHQSRPLRAFPFPTTPFCLLGSNPRLHSFCLQA